VRDARRCVGAATLLGWRCCARGRCGAGAGVGGGFGARRRADVAAGRAGVDPEARHKVAVEQVERG